MRVAFEDPADESGLCNLLKVVAGNAHKADTKSYRRVPGLINKAVEGGVRQRAPGREFDRRLQSIARCWSYRSSVIASNRLQKRLRPRAFWVQLCRSLRGLLSLSAVPSGYNASGDSRNASASRHAVPWSRHP